MHRLSTVILVLAGAAPAWAQDNTAWIDDARRVASSVPPKLLAVLTDEISRGGPESAIAVCRDKAPELAKAASEQTGWQVRRVSLRERNPKAVPDAWERAALEDFDRRATAGEQPATLEKAEIVTIDGRPVQQQCLQCHGPADQLKPAVKERLAALYPADRGTGYTLGQIRGAMTIRKPQ